MDDAVNKGYIWAYASFQFAIVILFAHIFYTLVRTPLRTLVYATCIFLSNIKRPNKVVFCIQIQLNVAALLSVLLSSFTGFGIAISTNALIVEYLRWRTSSTQQSSHLPGNRGRQPRQHLRDHHHHHHHNHHMHQHQQRLHQQPVHVEVSLGPMDHIGP